jgi:peptide/nickel transport system ATP-binding protein
MLQRAMIAQALAGEPDLLVADEPTTALDVTIQAQILDLLEDVQAERDTSIVLITHNLGVIARMADRVGVMYAGEIVERGTLADVFDDHVHPYTRGLVESVPDIDDPDPRLDPIEGNVPSLLDEEMGDRCYFADRCPKAMEECLDKPPEFDVDDAGDGDAADAGAGVGAGGTGGDGDSTGEHAAKCYLAEHDYDESRALADDRFDDEEVTADE